MNSLFGKATGASLGSRCSAGCAVICVAKEINPFLKFDLPAPSGTDVHAQGRFPRTPE